MARAREKPLFSSPANYEDDFYPWTYEQAELLRLDRFRESDLTDIIGELETSGRGERKASRSSCRLVPLRLLKWQFQPRHLSNSWRNTIRLERRQIEANEQENPSLEAKASDIVAEAYDDTRFEVADETNLPFETFPVICPRTPDQIRHPDFLPA